MQHLEVRKVVATAIGGAANMCFVGRCPAKARARRHGGGCGWRRWAGGGNLGNTRIDHPELTITVAKAIAGPTNTSATAKLRTALMQCRTLTRIHSCESVFPVQNNCLRSLKIRMGVCGVPNL